MSYAPEEFGKQYRIKVDFDGEPSGAEVYIHLVGTFPNDGAEHDVDSATVSQFENGNHVPYSILYVPPNCELIVVEEGV